MRLKQNSLVVSERLGVESFAEGYYRLYSDNLPVFITTDSILHTWHSSFNAILKDLETNFLMKILECILASMQSTLKMIPNKRLCSNADYFIGVARRLLSHEDRLFYTISENKKDIVRL